MRKFIRAAASLFSHEKRKRNTAEQAKVSQEVERVALCISELKPYKRRQPEVRCAKVAGFADAYRFLMRMCDMRQRTFVRRGGYTVFAVALPEAAGVIELTDRCGRFDKRVVAEIAIEVPALHPAVKKIKFISTKNEQIDNENNTNRIQRRRSKIAAR